jgi:hypothetical protein
MFFIEMVSSLRVWAVGIFMLFLLYAFVWGVALACVAAGGSRMACGL